VVFVLLRILRSRIFNIPSVN